MQLIWRTSGIFEVRARTTASLCFARILALQALSAFAAKTSRRLSLEATEPSDGSEREFTVFDKKTCVGTPYTKNLKESCVGWEGLTAEECELSLAIKR